MPAKDGYDINWDAGKRAAFLSEMADHLHTRIVDLRNDLPSDQRAKMTLEVALYKSDELRALIDNAEKLLSCGRRE